jgi:hypothetical protein
MYLRLFSALRSSPMIYNLSLKAAFFLVGIGLVVSHGFALARPAATQAWLKRFPRSPFWGTVLIGAATAWFWWLAATMDLHEFSNWKKALKIGTPIAGFLAWRYVPEFLAVRSLGMIVLLGAEALLEAAWMREETSRLFLVSLVYAWITAALFWVGMPYTLRDQIAWVTASRSRWTGTAVAGILYGVLLIALTATLRR